MQLKLMSDMIYGEDYLVRLPSPRGAVTFQGRDYSPRQRRYELEEGTSGDHDRVMIGDSEYSSQRVSEYDRSRVQKRDYMSQCSIEFDRLITRELQYPAQHASEYDRLRSRERQWLPQHGSEYDRLMTQEPKFVPQHGSDYERLSTRERQCLSQHGSEYDKLMTQELKFLPHGSEYDGLRTRELQCSPQRCCDYDRLMTAEHKYSPQHSIENDRLRTRKLEYLPKLNDGDYDKLRNAVDRKYLPGHQEMEGLCGGEFKRPRMQERDYSPRRRLVEDRLGECLREPEGLRTEHDRSLRPSYDSVDRDRGEGGDDEIIRSFYHLSEGLSRPGSTSSKFQWNHMLDDRGKADGLKSSNDFGVGSSGVGSAVVTSESDYFKNRYLVAGRSEPLFDSNPLPLEVEKFRSYSSSYPLSISVPSNSFGIGDGVGASLTSSSLGDSLRKIEDLHQEPYLDKVSGDRPLVSRSNPLHHSKDLNDYMGSSSRPKAFATSLSDGLNEELLTLLRGGQCIHSDGVGLSSGTLKPLVYEGYGDKSLSGSPRPPAGRTSDSRNFAPSYLDPFEGRHSSYAYQSEGDRIGADLSVILGNSGGVVEEYSHQDMLRTSSLGSGDSRFEYKRVAHRDFENNQCRELHGYGINDGPWSDRDRSDILTSRECYDSMSSQRGSPGDLSLPEPSNISGRISSNDSSDLNMSNNGRTARMIYADGFLDDLYKGDVLDSVTMCKKSEFTSTNYGKTGKGKSDLRSRLSFRDPSEPIPSLSSKGHNTAGRDIKSRLGPESVPSLSSEAHYTSGRDIKSRLGPIPQNVHVSHVEHKKNKSSLKKRLGHGPPKECVTLPSVKNHNAYEVPRTQNRLDESCHDQGGDAMESKVTPSNPEPPENSQEFKQLVNNAFFKFVKQLNETSVKRRKYLEQGKAGILKCIVCGSNSEEFQDTESLVKHALNCEKVGIKSRHLGFHKALCALIGWRSAEAPSSLWICETLSDAETSSLKEDLIIWPPVVIIHNTTIANDPDKRIIVSIEELEVKLRDLGFGDKTKVCLGKPANQSTMVVKFVATLSGSHDAERLHRIFVNTKHGRAELQQANFSNSQNSNGDEQIPPGVQLHEFLYGYLGIAEDLDKLDFVTKRICLVKSKKDIQDIADAPVKKRRK